MHGSAPGFFRLGQAVRRAFQSGCNSYFFALEENPPVGHPSSVGRAAEFTGGVLGVLIASLLIGMAIAHPTVHYAVTAPNAGWKIAFLAEVIISFFLFLTVLIVSNSRNWGRYTGFFSGVLVATYITFESPLSGMSMNPARSFASAFPARAFDGLWIYFLAPPIGMLLAAELYVRLRSANAVYCAKYHHHNEKRCIFNCRFGELQSQ